MKVAAIQTRVYLGEPEKNRENMYREVKKACEKEVDTLVLPELWNTGFIPENIKDIADKNGDTTKADLSSWSKEFSVNIVGGSVACEFSNQLKNSSFIFNRKGEMLGTYDKVHLFSAGNEDQYFLPGDAISHFKLDDIECSVMICYDLRFPELARSIALAGAKIIFVPAQWPTSRIKTWNLLLQARAVENQLFVVGANALGAFSDGPELGGLSAIFTHRGESLGVGGKDPEIVTGTLNMKELAKTREIRKIFEDRRPEVYRL